MTRLRGVSLLELMDLHDRRERTILYPTIERTATAEERRDLFERLEALAQSIAP